MPSPAEPPPPTCDHGRRLVCGAWGGRSESGLQLHLVSSVNRAERLARLLRGLAPIIAQPGLNPLELAEKARVSDPTLRDHPPHRRPLGREAAPTSAPEGPD